jgi:hypothetical protein
MSARSVLRLQLREDVLFSPSEARQDFSCPEGDFSIHDTHREVAEAFRILASGGATAETLRERFLEHGDMGGWLSLKFWLDCMSGLMCRTVETDDVRIATLVPLTHRARPHLVHPVDEPYALSRFAYLRRVGARMALESPLGNARVVLEDARALVILHLLANPVTLEELATETRLDPAAVRLIVNLLIDARAITGGGSPDLMAEDLDPILRS